MNTCTVHLDDEPIYDIVFEGSFERLSECLSKFDIANKRLCIVSDSRVSSLYLDDVKKALQDKAMYITDFVFEEGESSKNLDTVKKLYTHLIKEKFDRKDMLLALGGGVVGDLTGFTAATYLRGIDFVQIPTSLLAQVDSSIGGKTGVDFDSYKNMVGAFHMPKLVYMNLNTLKTLSDRQFNSGLGEILKHGLIKDKDYYSWIIDNCEVIKAREIGALTDMVKRSCEIKKSVVEKDPMELGERALLNFGHTLGHAIEKVMDFKLTHGECVGIGCILASMISVSKGYISKDDLEYIKKGFEIFDFPAFPTDINDEEVILATKNDKKMVSDKIKFILLKSIGDAIIDKTVSVSDMKDSLNNMRLQEI